MIKLEYRNKTIFQLVCDQEVEFGIKARWNYLETGHGKGPCDGLGASVKRMAHMAVKQQKCTIQDATDFYNWSLQRVEESKVRYVRYTDNDIDAASELMSAKAKAIPVPGTMKIHAICPVDRYNIAFRETSCYCDSCRMDVIESQCQWTVKSITKEHDEERMETEDQSNQQEATVVVETKTNKETDMSIESVDFKVNDYVAAVYDREWFLGQITEVDEDDCQLNFLVKAGKYSKMYKYPLKKDEIWIDKTDILHVLSEVEEVVLKSRNFFKIKDNEKNLIERLFRDKTTLKQ